MLEVRNLGKTFDDNTAVDDVSFSIGAGEIVGYLGPNGAGKSTTVKMITGLLQPDRGQISVSGFDFVEQPLEVKRRIGYVPESAAMYDSLTPNEYLSLVAELHALDREEARQRMHDLLTAFGIADAVNKQITNLSKGMRQKVLLVSALLHNPEVLLLDEPLNGLDVNSVLTFRRILTGLVERGAAVLYCSHLLDVVERLCGRIVLIDNGRVIADESTATLIERTSKGTLEAVFQSLTRNHEDDPEVNAFLAALDGEGAQK